MPFRWTVSWLDGKEDVELTEVQPNVPIDAVKVRETGSSRYW